MQTSEEVLELQAASEVNTLTDETSSDLLHQFLGLDFSESLGSSDQTLTNCGRP